MENEVETLKITDEIRIIRKGNPNGWEIYIDNVKLEGVTEFYLDLDVESVPKISMKFLWMPHVRNFEIR